MKTLKLLAALCLCACVSARADYNPVPANSVVGNNTGSTQQPGGTIPFGTLVTNLGLNRSYTAPTAISGAGDTSIALSAGEAQHFFGVTVQAGSGTYSATLTLPSTNAVAGSLISATIAMPASLNPTLTIKNLTSGGTTLGNPLFGRQVVRNWELIAQFDGSNWNVISLSQVAFTPIVVDFDYATCTAQDATGGNGSPWLWTIPAGATSITVYCAGPGNGGASGRRSSVLTAGGGGGGASGQVSQGSLPVALLSSTSLSITVSQGGAGGTAVSTDITNGNPGINASTFTTITAGGVRVISAGTNGASAAAGGLIGAGGAGGVSGNGVGNYVSVVGGAGGFGSTGSAGTSPQTNIANGYGAASGGGGGGVNTSAVGGGAGGILTAFLNTAATGGGATGASGQNGSAVTGAAQWYGVGGGGGGGNASGTGGPGGNGYRGGGGGGGGGSSGTSGAGGNGGDGFVRIIVS